MLGPDSYGILGAILSLLIIFTVPGTVITLTLTQIISEQNEEKKCGRIKYVLFSSMKILTYLGLCIFIFFILISSILKNLLNLPSEIPIICLGFSLIFITILPSPRGLLQGLQKFNSLGLNIALEKFLLCFFGALFIFFGMGVNGAILSYGIAPFIMLFFALIPLASIIRRKSESVDLSIYKYAFSIGIFSLCITIMSNIDTLFVRMFFTGDESGYFTAMKMLGEVIYFSALALGGVLLPKVSVLDLSNKSHEYLLRKALIYFGLFFLTVLTAFALAPNLIIQTFFGEAYTSISEYLLSYTFSMGVLSLAIIFMFYDISVKRSAFTYPLVLFTLIQITLLMGFHKTIDQIINIQILVFCMLLVTILFINLNFNEKKNYKKFGNLFWKRLIFFKKSSE